MKLYLYSLCAPRYAVLRPARPAVFNLSIEDRAICHSRVQAILRITVLNKFVELYLYEIVVVIGRDSLLTAQRGCLVSRTFVDVYGWFFFGPFLVCVPTG
jgi:hypothetical protein